MSEGNWNNEENSFSGSLDPTSVNAQQDTYTGAKAQTEQSGEAMPSDDNMYRFQNVNAGQKEPEQGQPEKKRKNSGGAVKIIVSAVVFGVVAAACFFVVLKISGFRFSGGSEGGTIGTVDTTAGNEVMAVSGRVWRCIGNRGPRDAFDRCHYGDEYGIVLFRPVLFDGRSRVGIYCKRR